MLGQDAEVFQSTSPRGVGVVSPLVWTFLRGLRSWQLFGLAVSLLAVDLVVPDPVPVVDEVLLGLAALLLARWKRPPTVL